MMNRSIWLPGIAVLLFTPVALGEPTEREHSQAQRLFDEAMELMRTENYEAACTKFEEGQRLAPAIGNQFNLAECYAKTGRLASAFLNYTRVADAAHKRGELERERFARERATQVGPRLSYVAVTVATASAAMVLECDGAVLAQADWEHPIPVDLGQHVFRATAPGKVAWSKTVEIADEGAIVDVAVPELAAVPSILPVTVSRAALQPSRPAWPGSARKTWALVSAGVGVAALGVGATMVVAAESKHSEADGHCDDDGRCDNQADVDALHTAKSLGDWANLPFGLGLAGVGLGAALWLTAPESGVGQRTAVRFSAHGVAVSRRF